MPIQSLLKTLDSFENNIIPYSSRNINENLQENSAMANLAKLSLVLRRRVDNEQLNLADNTPVLKGMKILAASLRNNDIDSILN